MFYICIRYHPRDPLVWIRPFVLHNQCVLALPLVPSNGLEAILDYVLDICISAVARRCCNKDPS